MKVTYMKKEADFTKAKENFPFFQRIVLNGINSIPQNFLKKYSKEEFKNDECLGRKKVKN